MSRIYKKHGSKLKAKIAIDAIREQKTLGELGKEYGIAPKDLKQRKQMVECLQNESLNFKRKCELLNVS